MSETEPKTLKKYQEATLKGFSTVEELESELDSMDKKATTFEKSEVLAMSA